MKFPDRFDHQRDTSSEPDVTRDVLDRLGVATGPASKRPLPLRLVHRFAGRLRFVGILGLIVLGSILWRAFSATEDPIGLVETFPQTIEQGRESRAQVFMGFMAPFERVGRAINEVDDAGGRTGLPDDPYPPLESLDVAGEVGPTSVDILEASAPFPNS